MKYIRNLGTIKLPYKKIWQLCKDTTTRSDFSYETERESYKNRSNHDKKFIRKIIKLYDQRKEATGFTRYYNTKLNDLMPNTFWKRFGMLKETALILVRTQPPGTFTIPHIDKFYQFEEQKSIKGKNLKKNKARVKRLIVTLDKPCLGHAIFVGPEVAYNLKQGTVIEFRSDVKHSACNAGYEHRSIMSVTGYHVD